VYMAHTLNPNFKAT